jgi:hypothetical protein
MIALATATKAIESQTNLIGHLTLSIGRQAYVIGDKLERGYARIIDCSSAQDERSPNTLVVVSLSDGYQQGSQEPPQSTPSSLPFFLPSVHAGAWHLPLTQTSLSQSDGFTHQLPAEQGGHSGPPQSTSVS